MVVGDWVKVSLYNWTVYGYVLETGFTNKVMQVYRVNRYGDVDFSNHLKEFTYNNITPLESSITSEDLLAMVDLALMTRDKEWFEILYKQLYERLEEEHA